MGSKEKKKRGEEREKEKVWRCPRPEITRVLSEMS